MHNKNKLNIVITFCDIIIWLGCVLKTNQIPRRNQIVRDQAATKLIKDSIIGMQMFNYLVAWNIIAEIMRRIKNIRISPTSTSLTIVRTIMTLIQRTYKINWTIGTHKWIQLWVCLRIYILKMVSTIQ